MTVQVKPFGDVIGVGWRVVRVNGKSHGFERTKPAAVKRAREVVYEGEVIEVLKRDGSLQRVIGREYCPRCDASRSVRDGQTDEICRLKGVGYFNATRAARVARECRNVVEITANALRDFVSERAVYLPHVAHVNPRKYGIVGTYREAMRGRLPNRPSDGDGIRHFILDGNHRAFRKLESCRSFKVFVLTLDETMRVFEGKRPPKGKAFVTD